MPSIGAVRARTAPPARIFGAICASSGLSPGADAIAVPVGAAIAPAALLRKMSFAMRDSEAARPAPAERGRRHPGARDRRDRQAHRLRPAPRVLCLLPITMVTWSAGLGWGLALSLGTAALWLGFYSYWEGGVLLVTFAVAVLLAARLREALRAHELSFALLDK